MTERFTETELVAEIDRLLSNPGLADTYVTPEEAQAYYLSILPLEERIVFTEENVIHVRFRV